MRLNTPVSQLSRVGSVVGKRLAHLGVGTIKDLLFYFPFRYEDFSQTKPISGLVEGEMVTVKGRVELIANKRSQRKRVMITEAVVADDSEQLRVVWFGQPFIAKNLKSGDLVYLSGKVTSDMLGKQMVSPAYEKITANNEQGAVHTARIVPIYPLTVGITQKQLRFLMKQAVLLAKEITDWLPTDLQDRVGVMSLPEAVKLIHFPDSFTDVKQAERRLKFDELFILQLRAEAVRQSLKKSVAPAIPFDQEKTKTFLHTLPFVLTDAQKKATWKILQDIGLNTPMNRMLEGDVGSGKTVVAAVAYASTIEAGYQCTMLAPTEILAKQHYDSFSGLMPDKKIALFTRSQTIFGGHEFEKKSIKGKKDELVGLVGSGAVELVIGTHALLVESVKFKNLGLVVVDEQHRFGVKQRKAMKDKSGDYETTPHFLSMTATPIPRSFALTIYGDLDISIINEMPVGRKPIKTRAVSPHNRSKAYEFIEDQVKLGRQIFVICPTIDAESDKKSVLTEYEKLKTKVFPKLKVGFIHGKLKSVEKDGAMKAFAAGEYDILVSTSVVEVGVNIPNASVMMIEGGEAFGLAQLHQFRGRVGRSSYQSYCFVFSDSDSAKVKERLEFFENNTDGFRLAEYDLEERGPGEVYGSTQSGLMNLKLASMRDVEIIKLARELARGIDFVKYPVLKQKVDEWEETVHLE